MAQQEGMQGEQGGMVCDQCGQSFSTQEELDRHVQEMHPGGGSEPGEGQEGMGGTPTE